MKSILLVFCTACSPFAATTPSTPEPDLAVLASRAVADTGEADPATAWVQSSSPEVDPDDESSAPPAPSPPAVVLTSTWELRRGESLAHFARWSELPVEAIAEASGLGITDALQVGVEVRVPGDGDVRARVEQARQRHHTRRIEGYLNSRGGAQSTAFHTVRTGDTAWSVAVDELGLPVWMLESFNPAVDLDQLRPGQQLLYPVVEDTVASVMPDAIRSDATRPDAVAPASFTLESTEAP